MAKKPVKAVEAEGTEPTEKNSDVEVTTSVKREVTRSASFVSLYANDVHVHTSPWDVRLILGEISGKPASPENPVLNVVEVGELRMSPQLAKRVTIILLNQLQAYEKLFGPIPLPPKD